MFALDSVVVMCDEMCAFDVWRYFGGGRQGLMVMFVAVVWCRGFV